MLRVFGTSLDAWSVGDSAAGIGYVAQSPENQLVCDTVWHELAFGLENLGVPQDVMHRRVAEVAHFFGIEPWMRRATADSVGRAEADGEPGGRAGHAAASAAARRADRPAGSRGRKELPARALPHQPRVGHHRGGGHACPRGHGRLRHGLRVPGRGAHAAVGARGGAPRMGGVCALCPGERRGPRVRAFPFLRARSARRVLPLRQGRRLGAARPGPRRHACRHPCGGGGQRMRQVDAPAGPRRCAQTRARAGEERLRGRPGAAAPGPQGAFRLRHGARRAARMGAAVRIRRRGGGRGRSALRAGGALDRHPYDLSGGQQQKLAFAKVRPPTRRFCCWTSRPRGWTPLPSARWPTRSSPARTRGAPW